MICKAYDRNDDDDDDKDQDEAEDEAMVMVMVAMTFVMKKIRMVLRFLGRDCDSSKPYICPQKLNHR